ncbi:MAG: L-threonylcarbamoyladenylate synthase [Verrucomicrobiales bacterium]|nr:L-threonylcarbamoyladenylate synthase [Verrucomicrobiales bacterium]
MAAAVEVLRDGEIVALPTETVYGLAADAFNAEAVAKVFEAKERPSFDPLIVHVTSRRGVDEVALEVPEVARALVEEFWPGALTLVLKKRPEVPDIVTAGLETVAVRMSAHPLFRKVAKEFGRPIAAPSANRFGSMSPTSGSAVVAELDGRIPLIVNDGGTNWGIESTIIRVEDPEEPGVKGLKGKAKITVLRAGPVTVEELKKFGKVTVAAKEVEGEPVVPGRLESHYAPKTPLRLLESGPAGFVAEEGKRYALLSYRGGEKDGYLDLVEWEEVKVLSPGKGKLPEAAVRLFSVMRQLDGLGVDEIVAEGFPEHGVGLAIMDRLRRAASECS